MGPGDSGYVRTLKEKKSKKKGEFTGAIMAGLGSLRRQQEPLSGRREGNNPKLRGVSHFPLSKRITLT